MNRRGFLSGLIGAVAAAAVDPAELLWKPGAKTIFIPPAPVVTGNQFLTTSQITQRALQVLRNDLEFMKFVDRPYDEDFVKRYVEGDWNAPYNEHVLDAARYQLGATVIVRKPPKYSMQEEYNRILDARIESGQFSRELFAMKLT